MAKEKGLNDLVRPAALEDAAAAIAVVRESISRCCVADHRNDPDTLQRWLENKTVEAFGRWLGDPENFCVVEEGGGRMEGVGLLRRSGQVLLFYVAPGCQRRGVGRRIHAALEARAAEWGLRRLELESTAEARWFYEALGYAVCGPERAVFGMLRVTPYVKVLLGA